MRMFRKEEGFTLVELMVVVLIIGILVAVAIPVFNSASASARRRACQANLRTLDGATTQWTAADEGNLKASIAGDAAAVAALDVVGGACEGYTGYVKDWDNSTACPEDDSLYTAAAGDWTCGYAADHNYENN